MQPDRPISFEDVANAKVRSRQADAEDLASGRKSREQLQAENSLVAAVAGRLVVRIGDAKPLR